MRSHSLERDFQEARVPALCSPPGPGLRGRQRLDQGPALRASDGQETRVQSVARCSEHQLSARTAVSSWPPPTLRTDLCPQALGRKLGRCPRLVAVGRLLGWGGVPHSHLCP